MDEHHRDVRQGTGMDRPRPEQVALSILPDREVEGELPARGGAEGPRDLAEDEHPQDRDREREGEERLPPPCVHDRGGDRQGREGGKDLHGPAEPRQRLKPWRGDGGTCARTRRSSSRIGPTSIGRATTRTSFSGRYPCPPETGSLRSARGRGSWRCMRRGLRRPSRRT